MQNYLKCGIDRISARVGRKVPGNHSKGPRPKNQHSQVGGFNPPEKYARQIGSFPQVGVKIKNV